jgi:hypothetical protein
LYDKLPEELIKQNVNCDERLEYLKTIKLAKKDNMTPENCYLCQLSQIPGVSIETANVIAGQYPSIRSLIMAYEALDNVPSKENLLAELSITLTNDKTRRLGNVISKRVFEFLCPGGNKLKLKLKSENEIKV